MKRGIFGLTVLMTLVTHLAFTQQIHVEVSRDSIKIGEQLDYTLSIPADSSRQISLPDNENFAPFEVVKRFPADTLYEEKILHTTYRLTVWDSGHYYIPSLQIKINDSLLTTDSIPVYVAGVQIDTAKQGLYPVKPAREIRYKSSVKIQKKKTRHWKWIFVLLLLGIPAYWFLRKKQTLAHRKGLSPYEKAIAEWNRLVQSKMYASDWERFYVKLTGLLDEYLEQALRIPAKESVSPELIRLLRNYRFENNAQIPARHLDNLKELLQRADLAKFAKTEPLPVFREKDLQNVKSLIDGLQAEIDRIEEQKRKEEELRLQAQRAKKRKKRLIFAAAGTFILIIASIWIYTRYKQQIEKFYDNRFLVTNNIPPPSQWKPVSLGSPPALVFTTPEVPQAVETYYPSDTLVNATEEFALLKSEMKNLKIYVWLFDLKKQVPPSVLLAELQNTLEQLTGENPNLRLNEQDMSISGQAGENQKLTGKLFLSGNKVRIIASTYPEGDQWEETARKILNTAALKN